MSTKVKKADMAAKKLRQDMAALLYPSRAPGAEQEAALVALEAHLSETAPPLLKDWWQQVSQGAPASEGLVSPQDAPLPKAATRLQAIARGHAARKRVHDELEATAQQADGLSDAPPSQGRGLLARVAKIAKLVGVGLVVGALSYFAGPTVATVLLYVLYYVALLLLALYAWMRLPSFLGWVGTECITRFALQGIPLGFETCRARLW